jgi:hypothetical protein
VEHERKIEDSADRRTVFATTGPSSRPNGHPPASGWHLSHWPAASEPMRHYAWRRSRVDYHSRRHGACAVQRFLLRGCGLARDRHRGGSAAFRDLAIATPSIDRRKPPPRPGINQWRRSEFGSVAHSSFGQVELDAKLLIYSPSYERQLFGQADPALTFNLVSIHRVGTKLNGDVRVCRLRRGAKCLVLGYGGLNSA